MYRVEVYEYVKKYKRFNRICVEEMTPQYLLDWFDSFQMLKLISDGYKIVVRPVDPDQFWDDVK